jgi:hypothetical protein
MLDELGDLRNNLDCKFFRKTKMNLAGQYDCRELRQSRIYFSLEIQTFGGSRKIS